MFGTHLGRGRGKIVAVADIGSGSAGVAILGIHPGEPVSVLAAERAILSMEDRGEEATTTGVADQLVKAGEAVRKKFTNLGKDAHPIHELYVIIRAPWSHSETKRVSTTFKEQITVTDHMIGELAERALAEVRELDRGNFLEAKVIRVELNGYSCAKPVGKHATEISAFVLISGWHSTIRAKIEASLQKVFPHLSPAFRSSVWAAIAVLREGMSQEYDYLIVDMSSEGTAFVAIRDGVATEHMLIQEGVRTILKRVSGSGMPEEALNLIRMLSSDQCSSAACEATRESLARAEPELVRVFGEALGTCASEQRLPNTLILFVHPDVATWLSRFFSRIDFSQFTKTAQPFQVRIVGTTDLSTWVAPSGGMVLDPGLALGSALVNIEKRRGQ
ncbi:MAG: hypothetical protein AAB804_02445 [Patescibacteria group bacterium]